MQGNKNELNNHMWQARKRLGLQQKQVAHLLGHKTTDQVSRYEQGQRLPGLKLFLQLEIIYGVPARVLYRDLYEELQKAIEARAQSLKTLGSVYTTSQTGAGLFSEFCSHEELLRNPNISQTERDQIRKHVLVLLRRERDL
jgi:transcriptional regulator with XRE-family HTH domain